MHIIDIKLRFDRAITRRTVSMSTLLMLFPYLLLTPCQFNLSRNITMGFHCFYPEMVDGTLKSALKLTTAITTEAVCKNSIA